MIFDFISKLAETNLLQAFNSTTDVLESADLFALLHHKSDIKRKKINLLKNHRNFQNIFVISNISTYYNIEGLIGGKKIINISDQDFLNSSFNFNYSLVLLTNNNLAQIGLPEFTKFIQQFETCVVAIHDFDNHHWHHLSIACAMVADIYIPAHLSNNIVASRINPNIDISLPCGTIQWSSIFLFNRLEKITNIDRTTSPLGIHNYYEKFQYRNAVISTLAQKISTIKLNSTNFHIRSADDRFNEWASHTCHWIIPVHNDLPIRFFDALITGGIPIVPSSLVHQMQYFNIPSNFYVTHDAIDILNPTETIRRANDLFINCNKEGILARFEYCINNFHVNAISNRIINYCETTYLNGSIA